MWLSERVVVRSEATCLSHSNHWNSVMDVQSLFRPFSHKSLKLKSRLVMAPMTRSFSPCGVPTSDVAAYYGRRAREVGLIISEGTVIDRPASANDPDIPHF